MNGGRAAGPARRPDWHNMNGQAGSATVAIERTIGDNPLGGILGRREGVLDGRARCDNTHVFASEDGQLVADIGSREPLLGSGGGGGHEGDQRQEQRQCRHCHMHCAGPRGWWGGDRCFGDAKVATGKLRPGPLINTTPHSANACITRAHACSTTAHDFQAYCLHAWVCMHLYSNRRRSDPFSDCNAMLL